MDDENWDMLGQVVELEQTRANLGLGQRITPSLVIRDALDRGHFRALRERQEVARGFGHSSPAPKPGKR
jgi:hypothetical protein